MRKSTTRLAQDFRTRSSPEASPPAQVPPKAGQPELTALSPGEKLRSGEARGPRAFSLASPRPPVQVKSGAQMNSARSLSRAALGLAPLICLTTSPF